MPTDTPSKADHILVARLHAAGISDMTVARHFRRRNAGLLPRPTQAHVPGRRGSISAYPSSTVAQAIALDRILKQHRSYNKAAVLLFLHGYHVDEQALRRSLHAGVDAIDKTIARHASGAQAPNDVPRAVAEGILTEPLRSKQEQDFRRRQLTVAEGRERLARAYEALARLYRGPPPTLGSLLEAFETLGLGIRGSLGYESREWTALELGVDRALAELRAENGLGPLLQSALPSITLAQLEELRAFAREALRFFTESRLRIELPNAFLSDLHAALLHPELEAAPTPDLGIADG